MDKNVNGFKFKLSLVNSYIVAKLLNNFLGYPTYPMRHPSERILGPNGLCMPIDHKTNEVTCKYWKF